MEANNCATIYGMRRLPRLPKPKKQTHTVTLRAVFASLDGKDSDDDAARFEKELGEFVKNFKAKSEFKYPDIRSIKEWETTATP
jgi:hypothetical protein